MRIDVSGLKLVKNTYHFRRAVPSDIRDIFGFWEWKKSLKLGPGQALEAHAQAQRLWHETQQQIDEARLAKKLGANPAVAAKSASEWAVRNGFLDGQPKAERETAWINGELVELDSERDLVFEQIVEQAGRDFGWDANGHPKRLTPEQEARLAVLASGKPVEPPMTVSQARDLYLADKFGGAEDKATTQATKQFIEMVGDQELTNITRPMVIKWLRDLASQRGQASGTIRRRLTSLRAIFNHMRKNYSLTAENPFSSQDIPADTTGPRKHVPFHRKHFELIEQHLSKAETDPDLRRIITLLKFTGCRPMEIGGLSKSEVFLEQDIPAIRVRWTADRRLKTKSSDRLVPLIGPAIQAAREAVEASAGDNLFPAKYLNTDRLSQTVINEIRKAGVPKSPNRLIAYSFRHSMKEALRMAEVLDDTQDALMGHAKKSVGAHYGASRRRPEVLKQALERAIPHLGDVDETEYLPGELP